ncbi:MAG TPA: hypothetical protein PKL69_05380 [Agitococcus sp.]|nr:hypothetical protein [Agitococcus sp.]HMY81899.1 hypothetical protein [Agitococcus sp.]HNC03064.1 hypothetical protein [Agitococcus sp.]HNJ85554.1 hypothetical protein [Agitococcus sp.]HNL79763.1 hypothetical protein [Agitococcus sp.]
MSVAYYICADVPEADENHEFFMDMDGKALASVEEDVLEQLAQRANVKPLMQFFSMPQGEWDDYVDDIKDLLDEDEVFDPQELTWFSADEGLKTVLALIAEIDKTPQLLAQPEAVIDDLESMAAILSRLVEHGIRWHLAIDI